jgi:hypothetical protein
MNSTSRNHQRDHSDLVLLYVLQTIPSSDVPAVDAQIAACAECQHEVAALRPIVDSFAAWPTDVLRPSASLWGHLARRIAAESGDEPLLSAPPTWTEPEWVEVAPGIAVKLLATDTERDRVSMLVHLAAGVDYPPHRHAGVEELHLLQGELMIDEKQLYPGDYIRAVPGSADNRVWSETGCTCVLITSPKDVLR